MEKQQAVLQCTLDQLPDSALAVGGFSVLCIVYTYSIAMVIGVAGWASCMQTRSSGMSWPTHAS